MEIDEIFQKLGIEKEFVYHKAVFTVDEIKKLKLDIEGEGCKNLFLTNKKNFYLVILPEDKRADMKEISKITKGHLSFAKEEDVKRILNLERGSLTPFGIINDKEKEAMILIDRELVGKKLLFHPNVNTATISISYADLIRFIEYEKNPYKII